MFRNRGVTTAQDWHDQLAELREYQKEISAYEGIMTLYERQTFAKEYTARKARYASAIESGVISEYRSSLVAFQSAQAREKAAKKNEINRWDPQKLASHMQTVGLLVDQAAAQGVHGDLPKAVEGLLNEARESGDLVKRRATSEVLKSAFNYGRNPEEKLVLNRIAVQAQRDLEALRQTDEMAGAFEAASKAFDDLQAHMKELDQVGQTMTGRETALHMPTSPYEYEMLKVVRDPQTGEIFTFDDWRQGRDFAESLKVKNSTTVKVEVLGERN